MEVRIINQDRPVTVADSIPAHIWNMPVEVMAPDKLAMYRFDRNNNDFRPMHANNESYVSVHQGENGYGMLVLTKFMGIKNNPRGGMEYDMGGNEPYRIADFVFHRISFEVDPGDLHGPRPAIIKMDDHNFYKNINAPEHQTLPLPLDVVEG